MAAALPMLHGVVMELEDCAFPLLRSVVATADYAEAFSHVDYAILVGAMPRKDGMERSDLLKANVSIFKARTKKKKKNRKNTQTHIDGISFRVKEKPSKSTVLAQSRFW